MLRSHLFGLPASQRFYSEDAGGGSGTATETAPPPSTADVVPTQQDHFGVTSVEGSKPPDFSVLRNKGEKPPETPKEGSETPPGDKKAAAKPTEGKEAAKKEEPKGEKPPEKPAEGKKDDAKPATKADDSKKGVPDDDKDLDDLDVKPGAGTKIKSDFDKLRAATKEARETARALKAEKAKLETEYNEFKTKTKSLTPEQEKEIADLRALRLMFEGENDPVFNQEFDAKAKTADENLTGFLKKNGLPEAVLKEINDAGLDKWPRWEELKETMKKAGDHLGVARVDALRLAREAVKDERQARIAAIHADPNNYLARKQQEAVNAGNNWIQTASARSIEIAQEFRDIFALKEEPANASAEQKKLVEEHNKGITALADKIKVAVGKCWERDPKTITESVMHAHRAEVLATQLEEIKNEMAEKDKRIEELEERLGGIRKAGKNAHADAAPAEKITPANPTGYEGKPMDAMTAFENWKATKGK